jgi:hypothetical protein
VVALGELLPLYCQVAALLGGPHLDLLLEGWRLLDWMDAMPVTEATHAAPLLDCLATAVPSDRGVYGSFAKPEAGACHAELIDEVRCCWASWLTDASCA